MKAAPLTLAIAAAVMTAGLAACSPREPSATDEVAEAEQPMPLPPLADDDASRIGGVTDPFKAPPAPAPPAGTTATPLGELADSAS